MSFACVTNTCDTYHLAVSDAHLKGDLGSEAAGREHGGRRRHHLALLVELEDVHQPDARVLQILHAAVLGVTREDCHLGGRQALVAVAVLAALDGPILEVVLDGRLLVLLGCVLVLGARHLAVVFEDQLLGADVKGLQELHKRRLLRHVRVELNLAGNLACLRHRAILDPAREGGIRRRSTDLRGSGARTSFFISDEAPYGMVITGDSTRTRLPCSSRLKALCLDEFSITPGFMSARICVAMASIVGRLPHLSEGLDGTRAGALIVKFGGDGETGGQKNEGFERRPRGTIDCLFEHTARSNSFCSFTL